MKSIFKQLHSLLSVRRDKLGCMCEVTILDPQVWDSRIMRESWQVYFRCALLWSRDTHQNIYPLVITK